jgi:hypothetical protein
MPRVKHVIESRGDGVYRAHLREKLPHTRSAIASSWRLVLLTAPPPPTSRRRRFPPRITCTVQALQALYTGQTSDAAEPAIGVAHGWNTSSTRDGARVRAKSVSGGHVAAAASRQSGTRCFARLCQQEPGPPCSPRTQRSALRTVPSCVAASLFKVSQN